MKFPSKVRTFKESILYSTLKVLEHKEHKRIGVMELFQLIEEGRFDVLEYKEVITLLYLIDKIDVDFDKEVIVYA